LSDFATWDLVSSYFGESIPPCRFNINLRKDIAPLPPEEERFVYLDNIKRAIFVMRRLWFCCEMRCILGMKFDTLKMTVGNADLWNETKLKRD
jgi:hypothetical protein